MNVEAAANICKRGTPGQGTQLEMTFGLQATFFQHMTRKWRLKHTAELSSFVTCIRSALGVN